MGPAIGVVPVGVLRVLLAVIVVVHHIPGHVPGNPSFPFVMRRLDAMVAVLIFYIFSGFYMSLVINEKYSKAARFPGSFYLSRCLRIFPLYWLILCLFYLYNITSGHPGNVGNIRNLTGIMWFAQVFMNLTTLGLDVVPSLGGYTLQLIGPAWSLGSELLFYAVAPWLVRLGLKPTIALVAVIFAVRLGLHQLGYDRYPLRVLFFPLSLSFFMLGHIAYHILARIQRMEWFESSAVGRSTGLLSLGVILASSVLLDVGRGIDPDTLNLWIFYALFTFSIPFTFIGFRRSKIDRFLGDLSFPIYISHSLVLTFVADYVVGSPNARRIIALLIALLFAVLLTLTIEMPVERARATIVGWVMQRRQPRLTGPAVVPIEAIVSVGNPAELGSAE